ncbi:MAG: hypothetical protein K6G10_07885 [Butyrivibrio sp.]|nr:hypothetical protein [Butyrivibrio sp.]
MKWKKGVEITRGRGTWVSLGDLKKKIKKEDEEILKLMEAGTTDDDELIKKLSKLSGNDEIATGFRLAQFVEDYGDFIAEGKKPDVFGI